MNKSISILSIFVFTNLALAEEENQLVKQLERFGDYIKDRAFFNFEELNEDHKTEHEHVFTPEEEDEFKMRIIKDKSLRAAFRFEQTEWNECEDDPTGNYSTYPCATSRQIAVILQDFLADGVYECVDAGLRAQDAGVAEDIHIVHSGILGDRNHSPQSLHAEARAIDISSFEVTLANSGVVKKLVYSGTTNREFYKAFRSCWGNVVHRDNGCPFYNGDPARTGSIGWEDSNHQHHMHTSVPYCVNGQYGDYYYRR